MPGVAPITRAPIIFERDLGLKSGERFGALRGGQFVFEELIFQLEAIRFGPQLTALFARVFQLKIVAEEPGGGVAHGLDGARDWGYGSDGPDAHHGEIVVALEPARREAPVGQRSPAAGR